MPPDMSAVWTSVRCTSPVRVRMPGPVTRCSLSYHPGRARSEETPGMSIRRLAAGATATALATLAAATCASAATFDLEAHRGGRGLRPENTLASFGHALQLGVRTLELDTGVTRDGVVVVSHERRMSSLECQCEYVGQLIHDLTLAQIKTLDCGTRHPADPATDPFVGTQHAVPGTRMPTLAEVFQLVNRYGADA